jgi:hypothetical protein
MVPTIASFEEKGWYLSQEGIDLIASEHPEANSLDDFINCAKDVTLFFFSFFFSIRDLENILNMSIDGSSSIDNKRLQQDIRKGVRNTKSSRLASVGSTQCSHAVCKPGRKATLIECPFYRRQQKEIESSRSAWKSRRSQVSNQTG